MILYFVGISYNIISSKWYYVISDWMLMQPTNQIWFYKDLFTVQSQPNQLFSMRNVIMWMMIVVTNWIRYVHWISLFEDCFHWKFIICCFHISPLVRPIFASDRYYASSQIRHWHGFLFFLPVIRFHAHTTEFTSTEIINRHAGRSIMSILCVTVFAAARFWHTYETT